MSEEALTKLPKRQKANARAKEELASPTSASRRRAVKSMLAAVVGTYAAGDNQGATPQTIAADHHESSRSLAGSLQQAVTSSTPRTADTRARADTDWFKAAKWGVFTHYLAGKAGGNKASAEAWNNVVDSFDTESFARQLQSIGARYYCITIGQNSGHYCAPNATYDRLVGITPSKCSRRDLVADLYEALAPRGIRLLVYLPSGAPEHDPVAAARLKWRRLPRGSGKTEAAAGERLAEFQVMWEAVIREWSLRWGKKVSGWWIDGVYHADAMYRFPEPPNFASFTAALKAGNQGSIVAFNSGVDTQRPRVTALRGSGEDYTAGEIDFALPVPGRWYNGKPAWSGRFIDAEQFHILSFLGEWWGGGEPRFPDELVVGYTKLINSHDGVVTWDVPVNGKGEIAPAFLRQLQKLNQTRL